MAANYTEMLKTLHDQGPIASWEHLNKWLVFFSYFGAEWLFRGVTRDTYKLIPKVGRPEIRKQKKAGPFPYSYQDERAIFEKFKQYARPHISSIPVNDLEWLAIAQHYGVPTRLLDWTENFLIAAWFAIRKGRNGTLIDSSGRIVNPAIWVARDVPPVSQKEAKLPFRIGPPKLYRPPQIAPRIAAQQGVFTIHSKPHEVHRFPMAFMIQINGKRCFELSKRLDACGINERLLYPELNGVGEYMAFLYRNNWRLHKEKI